MVVTSECHNCREADGLLQLLRGERSVLFPGLISHMTILQLPLLCVRRWWLLGSNGPLFFFTSYKYNRAVGWRGCRRHCEDWEKYFRGKKHTPNSCCHSRTWKVHHFGKTNSIHASHWKVLEKSVISPSLPCVKQRAMLGRHQTENMEASQEASLSSINYARVLSNQCIHSVNACGRWTNTCRLSGAARESDLFSKLVCLISPAWCWKAEHAAVIFQM